MRLDHNIVTTAALITLNYKNTKHTEEAGTVFMRTPQFSYIN